MSNIVKVLYIDAELVQSNNPLSYDVDLKQQDKIITCDMDFERGGRLIDYDGDYEVVPSLEEQYLATKNRSVIDDIYIYPTPVERIDNIYGGSTVIICGTDEVLERENELGVDNDGE